MYCYSHSYCSTSLSQKVGPGPTVCFNGRCNACRTEKNNTILEGTLNPIKGAEMNNKEIVKKMYQAYVEKDRNTIEKLIADDFAFTSPYDNELNRTVYFERCWPNSSFTKDIKIVRLIESDDQVVITYEVETDEGRRFRNTEIIILKNGQAEKVEVYFGWDLPHKAKSGGFINT